MICSEKIYALKMSEDICYDVLSEGESDVEIIDCSDINGTRCYLDDESKEILKERFKRIVPEGIHFIDSGNYHYLSLLMLEKIDEDFALFLFDNHPDMLKPSFGEITSCGGWVKEAIEKLPHLKKVYLIGMEGTLIEELGKLPDNVEVFMRHGSEEFMLSDGAYDSLQDRIKTIAESLEMPIYISFDEDVLSETELSCEWSQGVLNINQAKGLVGGLMAQDQVLGLDLCGENIDKLMNFIP